jgi:hypothetical protein
MLFHLFMASVYCLGTKNGETERKKQQQNKEDKLVTQTESDETISVSINLQSHFVCSHRTKHIFTPQ